MARNYYSLISFCQSNAEARQKCEEYLYNLSKEIDELMKASGSKSSFCLEKEDSISAANIGEEDTSTDIIRDPERRVVTKGRQKKNNRRIKNHFERKKTGTSRPNEYGTKTPVARLI